MGYCPAVELLFLGGAGEMSGKKMLFVSVALAFSTLALIWIPGLFAIATSNVPNATYAIVVVALLVLCTVALLVRYRMVRSELFVWCMGATMVAIIVPYAAYDGQMWNVWGLFFSFLIATLLNERSVFASHLTSESVFTKEEEERFFRSLTISGLRGAAFVLVILIVSTMISVVLPWLSMGNAPIWLIGALSIIVLLSLAYIAANRP